MLKHFFSPGMLVWWFVVGAFGYGIGAIFGNGLLGLAIALAILVVVCGVLMLWAASIIWSAHKIFKG